MSTPITLSGFNNIDFSVILNAVMQQERQPVTLLEKQQTVLNAQKTAFTTLATKLSSLQSAADALTSSTGYNTTSATVSDSSRVSFSAGSTAPEGSYEITVNQLARSQVSLLSQGDGNGYAARDTVVATGGTISFGADRTVSITGDTTLEGLASAINSADVGVAASVVKNSTGYHLLLTGQETGQDNAYTVTNSLTGALSGVAAVTKQAASDAEILLNNVTVTSSTNTFTDAIAGSSFTVFKQDAQNPVVVTITASNDSIKTLVEKVMTVFNDAVKFLNDQQAAANRGESNNIGRDALARSLRRELTTAVTAENTAGGGLFTSLAELGFSISRTGELSMDSAKLTEALQNNKADVKKLFYGSNGSDGVFGKFESVIKTFTDAGGLLPNAQQRLTDQATKIAQRIADMEARLETRRLALQKQYTAADLTISQLNQQSTSLSQLSSSL